MVFRTSLQDAPQSPYSDDEMLQKIQDTIRLKDKILIDITKPEVYQDMFFLSKLSEYALKYYKINLNIGKLNGKS